MEWRYLPGGAVVHALWRSGDFRALCGVLPAWWAPGYAWRGTGTQDEYETAASLPRCKRCTQSLGSEDPQ